MRRTLARRNRIRGPITDRTRYMDCRRDRPKHKPLQSCVSIFRKKYTGLNDHVKYKARLVAHGYRQVYGTDYWETYAPVSSSRAIRALLTLAASHKMIIHQMDVDTAFLNKFPAVNRGTLCQKRYISCIHVSRARLACSLAENSGNYIWYDLQACYGMISFHSRRV